MKRSFYYQDDTSNKFWEIEVVGTTSVSRNGKLGTSGRTTEKSFASAEAALKFASKQIASKIKKGYIEGTAPGYEAPDWAVMPMDIDTFWRLIALFDWSRRGDDDAVMRRAFGALTLMPIENLALFEELLAQTLYATDTEVHCDNAVWDGYVSDDSFLYARAAAVSSGREFYETLILDPREMPTTECEFESLLYLARNVYKERVGVEANFETTVSYESGSNKAGWPSRS